MSIIEEINKKFSYDRTYYYLVTFDVQGSHQNIIHKFIRENKKYRERYLVANTTWTFRTYCEADEILEDIRSLTLKNKELFIKNLVVVNYDRGNSIRYEYHEKTGNSAIATM